VGYRSNIPKFAEFCFQDVDETFQKRIHEYKANVQATAIVAGDNYGQGSSREHAAVASRYLGVRVVLAKSFARIYYSNLL
jgi:aconitate hydratase